MRPALCLLLCLSLLAVPASAGAAQKTRNVTMAQARTFAKEIASRTVRELDYDRSRVRCFRKGANDVRCRLRYYDKGRQVCSVQDRFWNRAGFTRSRYVEGTATGNRRC